MLFFGRQCIRRVVFLFSLCMFRVKQIHVTDIILTGVQLSSHTVQENVYPTWFQWIRGYQRTKNHTHTGWFFFFFLRFSEFLRTFYQEKILVLSLLQSSWFVVRCEVYIFKLFLTLFFVSKIVTRAQRCGVRDRANKRLTVIRSSHAKMKFRLKKKKKTFNMNVQL